ncbi:ABC transporter permease [Leuconostocaceae bacterium ESL0723]|nr:ABC transporter permease [Leuconostocaceae bacterium ESL0723]
MNPQIKTVAKFTFMNHVKTKSFWFMMLLPFVIFAAWAGVGAIILQSDNNTADVAVVGTSSVRSAIKTDSDDLNIHVSKITDEKDADKALKDGDIDAILTVTSQGAKLTSQPQSQKVDKDNLQSFLQKLTFSDRAKQYGLSDAQTAQLSQQFPLTSTVINNGKQENGDTASAFQFAVPMMITFIMFFVIMTYATILANEIANEKSSRIMETLLAASSAKAQYYGKLIGVMLLPIIQFLVYAVAFTAIYLVTKNQSLVKNVWSSLPHINGWALIYTLVFIIVGIALYMVVAALSASLVNDSAQVQQAVQPVTYLAMIPYLIGLASGGGNNLLVKIFAYIPFVSQTIMPAQLITQTTSWPLALLSLGIAVAFLFFFTRFGEKLYARNVLSYSDENITKQLMRLFKRHA